MLHLDQGPAEVPGLFSQFQSASELALSPSPPSRLRDRLALLGDKRDEMLKLVEEDRNDWGQRLKVIEAADEATQDAAVKAFNLKSRPLVGVSNLHVQDGKILGNTHPTPQVIYANLSKKGASEEILELSKIVGTSGVLIARDENGKAWLQVQGRNAERNFPHGGNLGCSPAGLFRYNYSDQGTREEKIQRIIQDPESIPVIPVGTKEVKGNVVGEAREEFGNKDPEALDVRIVGVAHDDTAPHYEILTLVLSSLTPDEMNKIAWEKIESLRSQDQASLHPHDFTEAYTWIEATPENIQALILTSTHSPATHIANWVAVGRTLVAETEGEREAAAWQQETLAKLSTRVLEMQAEVASFYHQNPEKFFSEIHKKEQRKFEEFSKGFAGSPQEVEAEMQSAITGGSEEALRVQRYLEKVGQPTRENYIAAAAMVKGIIHTPLDDNFDPRRLPDAQGLLSAALTFQKLKASGVEFYDGTMSF